MAGKRTQYRVVGRYVSGREVVGYHLVSLDNTKQGMYSREQVAFLVGRDQVINCAGQLTQNGFTLRGVGIRLDELPIKYIDKPKNATTSKTISKFTIVGILKSKGQVIGYMVRCSDGTTRKVGGQQTIQAAGKGMISNAEVYSRNGRWFIRGVGCELSKLPVINLDTK